MEVEASVCDILNWTVDDFVVFHVVQGNCAAGLLDIVDNNLGCCVSANMFGLP